MHPLGDILLYFAIPIKSFIFAGLYLWYCTYAARQNRDNIDHMAHFYGAIFGFLGLLLFEPLLIVYFFLQIVVWFQSF
jgi:membrane associated rhomboid family serine protease